ncbi:hypothetical protein V8E36_002114 [Tilletia maclaganii]
MARFLTLLPAYCLAIVFSSVNFTTAQAAPEQQQLCARFCGACEQVCKRDFSTTPANVQCKLSAPLAVSPCKGGQSVTSSAAMQGLKQALDDLVRTCRSDQPTEATLAARTQMQQEDGTTATVTLPAVTIISLGPTVTLPAATSTRKKTITRAAPPASTVTLPPSTLTETESQTEHSTWYEYYTKTYTQYDYYYLTETE